MASGLNAIRGAGFALAFLMAVAARPSPWLPWSGLALHARREEIDIMKLVGHRSPSSAGPFIAEGLLQGGFGAVVAPACSVAGFQSCGRLVGRQT